MTLETFFFILALVVALFSAWAYFTAQRLNTLHIRTDAALAQLEAALDRRAAVVAALAPELADVAKAADTTNLAQNQFEERSAKERALSDAIGQRFPQLPAPLVDAEARIQLAHRFYNEAVSDTRALRLRPMVRIFRLGGRAPLPDFFDYSFSD